MNRGHQIRIRLLIRWISTTVLLSVIWEGCTLPFLLNTCIFPQLAKTLLWSKTLSGSVHGALVYAKTHTSTWVLKQWTGVHACLGWIA